MKPQAFLKFLGVLLFVGGVVVLLSPTKASALQPIVFPVIGSATYSNDYYAARTGGIHGATDIFASKHRPLVSPVNGTIISMNVPEASWGYSITIRDADGYEFRFIHMNNDNVGTDDGKGGPMNAYAVDIKVGNPVVKGQLVGYLGDSGNAETTAPHLHFEIFGPDGSIVNPYDVLGSAQRLSAPLNYPALPNELLPYAGHNGTVNIAMGNFEGTSTTSEIVTGAGYGAGPHVLALNNSGTVLASFYAYDPRFNGGVDVAAGDVDGDGIDEIITGAGPGAGPHVMVYSIAGAPLASFYAFDPSFNGGIKVSAGDLDGDGKAEIIIGAGPSAGPHVIAYKDNGATVVASFYAYDPSFKGGVDVSAADVEGTAGAEIITGAGSGAGPHVIVYRPSPLTVLGSFYAYSAGYGGGVRVSAGNAKTSTSKAEVLTVPGLPPGSGPNVRMFDYAGTVISDTNFMESWWQGYHDIAAGYGASRAATGGNRRASIRVGPN